MCRLTRHNLLFAIDTKESVRVSTPASRMKHGEQMNHRTGESKKINK